MSKYGNSLKKIIFTGLLAVTVFIVLTLKGVNLYKNRGVFANHKVNSEMIDQTEKIVKITPKPNFKFSYDIMKLGVIQHLDRDYTYDYVPEYLMNGILFQGIHRPAEGTVLNIELIKPAIIYFFFHSDSDGGYSEIFRKMYSWERCEEAPKYDISNGTHGLNMTMYMKHVTKGILQIPATIKDRACFNIVFAVKD